MSFTQEKSTWSARRILGVVGGFLIVLVVGAGVRGGVDGLFGDGLSSGTATPERVGRALDAEPGLQNMMATFRTLYPAEYQELLRRLSDTVNAQGEQAASREAFFYMRRFMTSKANAIVSAPTADMRRLSAALLDLHQTLRRSSVQACAQFVMRGFAPGQQPPREAMEALGRANVAQLQAARNAEAGGRVERPSLTDEDADAWFRRLQTIDPGSAALIAGNRLEGADHQAQCNAGVAIYQATVDLPPEQSANVTAELIRETLRNAS